MTSQSLQEILCCIGQPVAGNPTQYVMEKCFARAGLDWRYLTLEVSPVDLVDAVRGIRSLGFRGGNVTTPHKETVIPYLDDLSEAARLIGAVNCINRHGDQLIGENTAGKGFLVGLREVVEPSGKHIAILGAGQTARAIAVELALAGAEEITIVNRTESHGQALVDLLCKDMHIRSKLIVLSGEYSVEEKADILINATSVGLYDGSARAPIAVDSLCKELIVADVIFSPPDTCLLADAQERGCRTLDGLSMLMNQALIAYRIWTNTDADTEVMREALEEFLGH